MALNARMLCLALLERWPMSGYEIRKLVADGVVSHFTEASYGSIYPALDRLEADGLVTSREERDPGKPARRVYEITPAGRAAFVAALHEPIGRDVYRSPFLLVAAYAPLVERRHLSALIEERLAAERADLAHMEGKHGECAASSEDPAWAATRWTLDYGRHMVRASIAFLEENRASLEALATDAPRSVGMPAPRAGHHAET